MRPTDFCDYPTGWAIQRRGIEHLDRRCSAVQSNGIILCDCGAVVAAWELMHDRPDFEDWLAAPTAPEGGVR